MKSSRQTLRRTLPRKGIEVPPYEIIAVLTGATLNKFKSLVAFLYRCKGTTLYCASVSGWKRRKFPDSNFNVTSCESSRFSPRQKLRLIIHPPINEHDCLAATVYALIQKHTFAKLLFLLHFWHFFPNAGQFSRFVTSCIHPQKSHVFTRESAPLVNRPRLFFPDLGFLEKAFTSLGSVSLMLAPPTTFISWIIISCAGKFHHFSAVKNSFCEAVSLVPLNPEFRKQSCPIKFDLP